MGQMLLTWWLSASYSGERIQWEGAPQTAVLGFTVANGLIFAGVILYRRQLRPRNNAYNRQSPMVQPKALKLLRTQSFLDCVIPMDEDDLVNAEFLMAESL